MSVCRRRGSKSPWCTWRGSPTRSRSSRSTYSWCGGVGDSICGDCGDGRAIDCGDGGVVECGDGGVIDCGDGGVIECGDGGVIECGDGGVINCGYVISSGINNDDGSTPTFNIAPLVLSFLARIS